MHSLFLRGSFFRPSLETTTRLAQKTPGRSTKKSLVPRNSRRQQSSSSSSSSTPSSQTQSQIPTHAEPQFSAPKIKSDPIPVSNVVAPLPFWQRLGPLTRAGQAYARAQRSRPWATQVASSVVIYLCADFGAQWMDQRNKEEGERKRDWVRTARSLAIGCGSAIPGYLWFTWLSRSFNFASRTLSIATKVVVNQLVFTPIFNAYFFGSHALLSGDTPAEAWRRVCNTVPVSFVNSCKLWPAVTAFSFAFIPIEYRSVFGGIIGVGWQTYLSYLNGRAERMEAMRQKDLPEAAVVTTPHVVSPVRAVQMVQQGLPGKQAALA